MKVLVVHNNYSSRVPSGENMAVENEVRWLREAGIDVAFHETTNDVLMSDSIAVKAQTAVETIWSLSAQARFQRALDLYRPDIVHVHNLFPLFTASVPSSALRRNIPVVWTAHNSRTVCVEGTHFRDGSPCQDCRPGWRVPGIRYGCYRGSKVATALVTEATSVFRRIARRHMTTIATSKHMQGWLVQSAHFEPNGVTVKYNGVAEPSPGLPELPPPETCSVILFAGHLTAHKGPALLLDAWRQLPNIDAELRLVGDGPLATEVRTAAAADPRITWYPPVSADEMPRHLSAARAVVVPSVCEESFGRTAAEALAYRRPVITTGLGGLKEIVNEDSGWLTGTNSETLAKAIEMAATSNEAITQRSNSARERHKKLFSPTATTNALIQIYETTLA